MPVPREKIIGDILAASDEEESEQKSAGEGPNRLEARATIF